MTAAVAVVRFREHARAAAMPLDNLVTIGFQVDRAVLRLRLEVERATPGSDAAEDALLWLDLVQSRLPLLSQGVAGALIRTAPEAAAAARELKERLHDLDAAVAGAPDEATRLHLLRELTPPLHDPATRLGLATVHLAAGERTREARELEALEARIGWLVGAAAATAACLFGLLLLQARRLARERQAAEAASAAKTTFLANMSHELRTPLNGVLGMLDLLADEALPPAARERAETARSSARQLLGVIGDILDISKLEAGRIELERVAFGLPALLGRCHGTFAAAAEAKGVALRLDLAAGLPDRVLGDPTRLAQIVNNLLSNAVKFTERGEIVLAARRPPAAGEEGRLVIEVRDSGIGIAPDALGGLFRKFTQADASTTRRFGGTGLGLAITRELAELMGGRVEADSTPGRGTTMRLHLDLPLAEPAAPPASPTPAAPAAAPAAGGPRVLLVEDDRVGQLVATAMLRKLGAHPVTAASGLEAVAAAGREPFDLILMDIQMPVMDGLAATRAIRAGGGPNARTRIVALSANAFREDVERSLEAGMDDHAAKPIARDVLARLLAGEAACRKDAA